MRGATRSARRNPRWTSSDNDRLREQARKIHIARVSSPCAPRAPDLVEHLKVAEGEVALATGVVDSRSEADAKGRGGSAREPKCSTAVVVDAEIGALRANVRRRRAVPGWLALKR